MSEKMNSELIRGDNVEEGDWFTFTTTSASLLQLRERNPDLFFTPANDWWFNQAFAHKKREIGRKLHLRTSPLAYSFGKPLNEQLSLLPRGAFVPSAHELIEGIIAHYQVTREWLFSTCWVRTSDTALRDYRVGVGYRSSGLFVFNFWDDISRSYIGLAVARVE